MSFSNPRLTNPSTRTYQWLAQKGGFAWWDKESKKNVEVDLPFEFIVLDQLSAISGFSRADNSAYWSNEIRTMKEELVVRTKAGIRYAGPYKNEQGIVQTPKDSKYAKFVYIAYSEDGEWKLGRILFVGSSVSSWIEHTKGFDFQDGKVAIDVGEQEESASGPYYPPIFDWISGLDSDEYKAAYELDKKLQEYLDGYLKAPLFDDTAEPIRDDERATQAQRDDFEQRRKAAASKPKNTFSGKAPAPTNLDDDYDDQPINLDDIPF